MDSAPLALVVPRPTVALVGQWGYPRLPYPFLLRAQETLAGRAPPAAGRPVAPAPVAGRRVHVRRRRKRKLVPRFRRCLVGAAHRPRRPPLRQSRRPARRASIPADRTRRSVVAAAG